MRKSGRNTTFERLKPPLNRENQKNKTKRRLKPIKITKTKGFKIPPMTLPKKKLNKNIIKILSLKAGSPSATAMIHISKPDT